MLEEEQVAFFLASRLITRGNKGTLLLTIMIIAMVFVNLIFLPSIIAGIVVLFNQQNIDYSYGNLVIEPGRTSCSSPMSRSSSRRSTGFPGLLQVLHDIPVQQPLSARENPRHRS